VDLDPVVPGRQIALRAAIRDANPGTSSSSKGIYLPAGIYNLTLGGNAVENNSLFNDLDIVSINGNLALTIVGAGAGQTVIDATPLGNDGMGQHDGVFHVYADPAFGRTATLNLSRITVTGGHSGMEGGGIVADGASIVNVSDSTFVGNSSVSGGGAIRILSASSALNVANSVFIGNTAGTIGGAIYATHNTNLSIRFSVFANNSAPPGNPANVVLDSTVKAINFGHNLVDSTAGTTNFFSASLNDYISVPLTSRYVVTGLVDTYQPSNDSVVRSLREAVVTANTVNGANEVWIPAWAMRLSITGTESATTWDLDVSDAGDMTRIVGTGAGATVIKAVDGSNANNRHFQVAGNSTLDLHRLTLTGGYATLGGAIRVDAGTSTSLFNTVNLTEVAIVNNDAGTGGGALQVGPFSKANVIRSVIVNDEASYAGGGIYAEATSASNAWSTVTLNSSIVANNDQLMTTGDDLYSVIAGSNKGRFISQGNNFIESTQGAYFPQGTSPTDYANHTISTNYVVTSVIDVYSPSDDAVNVTLRDVIDRANNHAGSDEIWVAGWNFLLTQKRAPGGTDTDVTVGDLDIKGSLVMRGVAGQTFVSWNPQLFVNEPVDKTFELLGDYNSDGTVNGLDEAVYNATVGSTTDLRADGDDDYIVDMDDRDIWATYQGNTLTRFDVTG
jgi:predicted outer membrane repeat protein